MSGPRCPSPLFVNDLDPTQIDPDLDFSTEALTRSSRTSGSASGPAYMRPQDIARLPDSLISAHPAVKRLENEVADLAESRDKLVARVRELKQRLRAYEDAELLGSQPSGSASGSGSRSRLDHNSSKPSKADEDKQRSRAANKEAARELPDHVSMWRKKGTLKTISKEDVVVTHTGEKVGKAACRAIEDRTALLMAFIYSKDFEEDLLPHEKNLPMSERNYSKLTSDYMHVLEAKVCKPLVEEFPELGYCENHYKPLLFVHAHVKAKVERLRKLESASNASSSSVISSSTKKTAVNAKKGISSSGDATAAVSSKQLGKRRERTDDQEDSVAKKRTKEASRQRDEPDEFDDVYSTDEDSAPVVTKNKKKQPIDAVRKLQELFPQSYKKDTDDSDVDTAASSNARAATASSSSARAIAGSSSNAPAPSSLGALVTSARPEARKLHKAIFPGTKSTSAEASRAIQRNAVEVNSDDPFTAAAESLVQMRERDAAVLVEPELETVRSALKDRYSALGKAEADATRLALRAVEMAELCGYIPDGEGEADFTAWLTKLENAAPEPENEDNHGPSFGHDLFSAFKYRDRLRSIESWGGVKNACRLIRALLRIWAISSEQIKAMSEQAHGPLARIHIGYVAQLIVDTFKKPTPAPTGSTSKSTFGTDVTNTPTAPVTAASASAATASSAANIASSSSNPAASASAGSSTSRSNEKTAEMAKKDRRRIAKTLESGKVTEDAIRSLTRKAAVPLLGTSTSANVKKANRAQVLDMLVQAWKNGTVKLTAAQIQAARGGAKVDETNA